MKSFHITLVCNKWKSCALDKTKVSRRKTYPRRVQASLNLEAIPDLSAQLPSDLAVQPDVAAIAFPRLASGSWHTPGTARGAIPIIGVGAHTERIASCFSWKIYFASDCRSCRLQMWNGWAEAPQCKYFSQNIKLYRYIKYSFNLLYW